MRVDASDVWTYTACSLVSSIVFVRYAGFMFTSCLHAVLMTPKRIDFGGPNWDHGGAHQKSAAILNALGVHSDGPKIWCLAKAVGTSETPCLLGTC